MATKLLRCTSTFDSTGLAVVSIPIASFTVALRFHANDELNPEVEIVVFTTDPPKPGNYHRRFWLLPEGHDIPATFRKYIGTFPYGRDKVINHVIEVGGVT